MRFSRVLSAAAVGALAVSAAAPAGAATPGVGSTAGTLSVLQVDAGNLLSLDLLTDRGEANTNPSAGAVAAGATIELLSVASEAAGLAETVPVISVTSTGERQATNNPNSTVSNPVVNGSLLPVDISALVDANGAASGITAGLGSLDVLGGLMNVSAVDVGMSAQSLTEQANGLRGLDVDALTVLDLEAFLAGLGIALPDLSPDQIFGLIDSLGVLPQLQAALDALGVPASLTGISDLESLTSTLSDNISSLEGLAVELGGSVCEETDPALELLADLLDLLPADVCTDIPAALISTTSVVTDLLDDLGSVLQASLEVLDGVALLSLDGLDVTVVTRAADTLDASAATVTATLGGLRVGDGFIPGLDLLATADQINNVLGQVETSVGSVLGSIDPGLSNIIDVNILQKSTSVTEDAGAIIADASLTGVIVTITPNVSNLLSILSNLGGNGSIGEQITDLGGTLPGGAAGVEALNAALAGLTTSGVATPDAVLALSEGGTVSIGTISQRSTFSPNATTTSGTPLPATSLPKTGGPSTSLLLFGGLAVIGALTLRRTVRIDR